MQIPLAIKVTIITLIILGIILVIAIIRKKRRWVWPLVTLILVGIGFGAWKGLSEYNRTNEDLTSVKADLNIPAAELVREYEANDSTANLKFLGRIVEIEGNIKRTEVDDHGFYTVILGDTNTLSSVRCAMDSTHNQDAAHLVTGSSIRMRGACTGFMKDEMGLGSDVILNRCVVIANKE